jgi:hypothetical protein
MRFFDGLLRRSVTRLTRVASGLTLVALTIMVYSVLDPRVLPVMFAMSVGQVIGATGFGFFVLAVVIDAARSKPRISIPPGAGKAGSPSETPSTAGER